jgi:hypothetical protein
LNFDIWHFSLVICHFAFRLSPLTSNIFPLSDCNTA